MTEHDCEKHDNRKRFNHLLKTFLAEKVEAGSYLAEVTPEAYGQLDELIHLLIVLKWERDCDWDLPIKAKTWILKEHMQASHSQFVINRDPEKEGGLVRWLGKLATNVKMAAEALELEVRCLENRKIKVEMPDED